jgi:hypothetical protein
VSPLLVAHVGHTKTYPDPDNPNPTTRDWVDFCEAPINIRGDEGRHQLSNAESADERKRWTPHKEEPMRTSHKDQCLRDDSHLKVDDHSQLRVPGTQTGARAICLQEGYTELVLEEIRFDINDDKGYTGSKLAE